MAKKMKKTSTRIDMTAMCDVSFLLLTFFVLTSTAKVPEVHPVDLPDSTKETKIPATEVVTISIDDEKIFFGIAGRDDKKDILTRMGSDYNITFTQEELDKFAGMENFGLDIRQLKQLLSTKPVSELMKPDNHPNGIPYKDSLNNQLSAWVRNARESSWENKQQILKVAIKGDKDESYGTIKEVIDILQDQRQNRFYLVTGLRDDDF